MQEQELKKFTFKQEDLNEFTEKVSKVIDRKKGILLLGPVGCGKTTTMNTYLSGCSVAFGIGNMPPFPIKGTDFTFRKSDLTGAGIASLTARHGMNMINTISKDYALFVDDIGTEQTSVNYFGDQIEVISTLLFNRHASGYRTYATSNLNLDQLREKYGDRIFSRMFEMFNIIIIDGVDLRSNKVLPTQIDINKIKNEQI